MPALQRIGFLRDKYGRELLVDVGRIRDLRHFVRDPRPHALAFYDVMLVTAGRGRVELDSRGHRLAPGRVFFTAPGQARRLFVRGLDGWCLFFEGAFVADFLADPLFLNRLHFFHDPAAPPLRLKAPEARAVAQRLGAMRNEIRRARADSPQWLRAGLFEVLVRLNRAYALQRGLGPLADPPPLVLRLRDLVERHFRETHAVAAYARRLKVTPGHLSWLTRRHLGQSAGAVLRARVVTEARRLLAFGDDDVAAVAATLGFADPAYFSRFFRRETGISPAAFRRAQRPAQSASL
jgi:AraC-like DNA-binding protein